MSTDSNHDLCGSRKAWLGFLIAAVLLAAMEATRHFFIAVPNPVGLYVLGVIACGFFGGLRAGLIGAGMLGAYGTYDAMVRLPYGESRVHWLVSMAIVLPVTAIAVGVLRRRLEREHRAVVLKSDELRALASNLSDEHGQLKVALETMAAGFAKFSPDFRLMICNERFRNYFPNLAPIVLPGLTFHEWIHAIARSTLVPEAVGQESDWAKRELAWFHRLMEPRQYALSDGRAVEVSTSKFDSFGYVVLLHDITAVRQREQELQDRAEYNRALLDNVINAVVAIDARGRVRVFNKSAEQIFGYRAEEVIGENVKILMPESFRAQHDRGLHRYMTTGVPNVMGRRTRLQGRRKDGSIFPMELGLGEFNLAKKRQFIACIQDLAEAERMEAELRQAQKMEALGQLACGVAHDANNMLSVIFGNLELFDRTVDEDSRQLSLQFVKNAALRLEGLTQRMLAFSRRRNPSAQAIDTAAAIRSVGELMGTLLGGRIVLDVSPAADTWPSCVDLNEFETVLVNLAVNARDAMPDGGTIKFETANFHADANAGRELAAGDYVVVSVADTGTGMPPEILRRACEPFFTTKAQGKGTGLGLSLAYGFAKKHGGTLNIVSTPGHGTTVQLFLPRHAAGAALENPQPVMGPNPQAMGAHT